MLVNYRYGRAEDDFTGNILTVITPTKAHNPRATTLALDAIKEARTYMLQVLNGERLRAKLPHRFVCEPCRMLWRRRFRVLKKRERTHVNKFLAQRLSQEQLTELRLVHVVASYWNFIYYFQITTTTNDLTGLRICYDRLSFITFRAHY